MAPPDGRGASLVRVVQRTVWEVDAGVPVARDVPFDDLILESVGDRRLLTLVLGVFAIVALAVGAIGVFGVVSFAVSRRTREIGIRMALGATRGTVRGAVFGRGITGEIFLGVVAALGLTRFLRDFLFEVGTTDPVTFAGVAALLAMVAATAIRRPGDESDAGEPGASATRGITSARWNRNRIHPERILSPRLGEVESAEIRCSD